MMEKKLICPRGEIKILFCLQFIVIDANKSEIIDYNVAFTKRGHFKLIVKAFWDRWHPHFKEQKLMDFEQQFWTFAIKNEPFEIS